MIWAFAAGFFHIDGAVQMSIFLTQIVSGLPREKTQWPLERPQLILLRVCKKLTCYMNFDTGLLSDGNNQG